MEQAKAVSDANAGAGQERFDAIVLAGYDPERPHRFEVFAHEPHKVLIPAGGRPMLARVLDSLLATPVIGNCVVVGFGENPLARARAADGQVENGEIARAEADGRIHYVENQGSIYHNLIAAFQFLGERQGHERHVFIVAADVPLLQPEHVRWFVDACRPLASDLYMGVVEKGVMERTFPTSTRTYVPLVEGRFCNGELILARIGAALNRQTIYEDIIARRKSTWRQVQLLGPTLLLKFLFRRLSLDDVLDFVRRRIRIEATAVQLPFAETGMDVDKPAQLALVESYLAQQQEGP